MRCCAVVFVDVDLGILLVGKGNRPCRARVCDASVEGRKGSVRVNVHYREREPLQEKLEDASYGLNAITCVLGQIE